MNTEADLARITQQEQELQLPSLSLEDVWAIGSLARSMAAGRGLTIAIEIRRAGHVVFFACVGSAVPNYNHWLRRKANTAQMFLRSTYAINLHLADKGQSLSERHSLSEADYVADGGVFPLAVKGTGMVGTLGISGMDQRADHEFAVEVLCRHLGKPCESLMLGKA